MGSFSLLVVTTAFHLATCECQSEACLAQVQGDTLQKRDDAWFLLQTKAKFWPFDSSSSNSEETVVEEEEGVKKEKKAHKGKKASLLEKFWPFTSSSKDTDTESVKKATDIETDADTKSKAEKKSKQGKHHQTSLLQQKGKHDKHPKTSQLQTEDKFWPFTSSSDEAAADDKQDKTAKKDHKGKQGKHPKTSQLQTEEKFWPFTSSSDEAAADDKQDKTAKKEHKGKQGKHPKTSQLQTEEKFWPFTSSSDEAAADDNQDKTTKKEHKGKHGKHDKASLLQSEEKFWPFTSSSDEVTAEDTQGKTAKKEHKGKQDKHPKTSQLQIDEKIWPFTSSSEQVAAEDKHGKTEKQEHKGKHDKHSKTSHVQTEEKFSPVTSSTGKVAVEDRHVKTEKNEHKDKQGQHAGFVQSDNSQESQQGKPASFRVPSAPGVLNLLPDEVAEKAVPWAGAVGTAMKHAETHAENVASNVVTKTESMASDVMSQATSAASNVVSKVDSVVQDVSISLPGMDTLMNKPSSIVDALNSKINDLKADIAEREFKGQRAVSTAKAEYEANLTASRDNSTEIRKENARIEKEVDGLIEENVDLRKAAAEVRARGRQLHAMLIELQGNVTTVQEYVNKSLVMPEDLYGKLKVLRDLDSREAEMAEDKAHHSRLDSVGKLSLLQVSDDKEPTTHDFVQYLGNNFDYLSEQQDASMTTLKNKFMQEYEAETETQESLLQAQEELKMRRRAAQELQANLKSALEHVQNTRDYLRDQVKGVQAYALKMGDKPMPQ